MLFSAWILQSYRTWQVCRIREVALSIDHLIALPSCFYVAALGERVIPNERTSVDSLFTGLPPINLNISFVISG